ncbi:MAG: flap endonuclease-1 [Candidatus Lokiarchaeota archaeon]|nr:flap endonuclease-1 [Candidatus Lokiarchaeota archaeon]MBD3199121.1 flap endonuclease-1 [Candidatus Lokiarchaeota archaeon]
MGVKINELVKEVKRSVTFENLFNKKIAIDAFNTIYQFLAIIRQRDGTPLKDYEGNITSHLSGLFYRTINFIEQNIKPIYVFDGKPSELKLETIKERREVKKKAKKKMIEAQEKGDLTEAKKFAQMTSKLTTEMIEESKKLIEYLGIPVIQAPSEGEAQSAYMVEAGDTWACASQDYDTLLFGGKRLVRNFAVSRSKKVKNTSITLDIEYVSLTKFLEKYKISREQLIEMGILIGTDFFPGIKGVGQHTALDLIKKHKSIENMINNDIKAAGKEIIFDMNEIQEVKNIFLNPDISRDYPAPKWHKINFDKIEELLVEVHNFSKSRVINALDRLKKIDTSKTQVSLDSFFGK